MVNKVMLLLFMKYLDVVVLVGVDCDELEVIFKLMGFFWVKIDSVMKLSAVFVEWFDGEVLFWFVDFVILFGVGCKIVNVVFGNVFGIFGIIVDMYFGWFVCWFGWIDEIDLVKVEYVVGVLFECKDWIMLFYVLIFYGCCMCYVCCLVCGVCFV